MRKHDDSARLNGKLSFDANVHPFIKHFKFLKALADEVGVEAKITIPAHLNFMQN